MTTVSPTTLRTQQARASIFLSVCPQTVLLSAQVNGSPARGARSFSYDTGSGALFALITEGQTIVFDTPYGLQRTMVKSVVGTAASGTVNLYESKLVLTDNDPFQILFFYEPHPIPPAIRSGVFYKFYDTIFSTQNTTPNPIAIAGPNRAGFVPFSFSVLKADSYAIASGATISSIAVSASPAAGITVAAAGPNYLVTVNDAGEYWLKVTATDSNGKTQETFRYVRGHDRTGANAPYTDFTVQSFSGDWAAGGYRVSIQATGDVELSDFPDRTLAILWYENTFNGVEGYTSLWGTNAAPNVLCSGYLRQDNSQDNWGPPEQGGGTAKTTFQITTIDDLLNNVAELGSVSLNATASPAKWYEYASWMTTGRSIHHLLRWQAWGVFQCADVFDLTANTLGVKTTDYSESSLLQQVNGFALDRGIFAKLICDRLGRLHLVTDSQMLSDAARAALDTVFTITEADVSGGVDVARAPEETTTFTQLDGFSFDGTTSTPFISIIPGYREISISYIMPEERGGSTAAVSNQVLADQTDSNVRVGRYHAVQNNNPRELRFSNPYNGLGAFDIIPSIGWYGWGIANSDLKRNTELFGKLFICRHIDVQVNHQAGTILTNVVLEREAIGPPGIQGNYPTGYPATSNNPTTPGWTPPDVHFGPVAAYYAGGLEGASFVVTADKMPFSTGATAANAASNLSVAKGAMGAISDTMTYGYFVGGFPNGGGAYLDSTDRLVLSTGVTSAFATAVLFIGKESLFGLSDGETYGYFAGGNLLNSPFITDSAERLTFFTGVIASNGVSDLSGARSTGASLSDGETYGYFAGGYNVAAVEQATTDRITFATGATAANAVSDLSLARTRAGAVPDGSTYGYFGGGGAAAGVTDVTDRITFATGVTAANAVSNLTAARTPSCSSGDGATYGYFLAVPASTSDRITFATGVTAGNGGSDLSSARTFVGGISDGVA